jgi:hypothetical protein
VYALSLPCFPVHPPASRRRSSALVLGRSLGGPGLEAAIGLTNSDPEVRVTVFEATWSVVDQDRAVIAAHGLDGRITARHVTAWRWALLRDRQAA